MGGPNKEAEDVVNLEPVPERDFNPAVGVAPVDDDADEEAAEDDEEDAVVDTESDAPFPDTAAAASLAG